MVRSLAEVIEIVVLASGDFHGEKIERVSQGYTKSHHAEQNWRSLYGSNPGIPGTLSPVLRNRFFWKGQDTYSLGWKRSF